MFSSKWTFVVMLLLVLVLGGCSKPHDVDRYAPLPATAYAIRVVDAPKVDGAYLDAPHEPPAFQPPGVPEAVNPADGAKPMPLTSMVIGKVAGVTELRLSSAPGTVDAGSSIRFDITPPVEGVYKYGLLYREGDIFKGVLPLGCDPCVKGISVPFDVPPSWAPGTYELRVYNYGPLNWERVWFTVKGGDISAPSLSIIGGEQGSAPRIDMNPGPEGFGPLFWIFDGKNNLMDVVSLCTDVCDTKRTTLLDIPKTWPEGQYILQYFDQNEPLSANRVKRLSFAVQGSDAVLPLTLSLAHPIIPRGEPLLGTVHASTYGAFEVMRIMKDGAPLSTITLDCDHYKCFDAQSFSIDTSELSSGSYILEVFDYRSQSWLSSPFSVQ